jgi:hypothetical protein
MKEKDLYENKSIDQHDFFSLILGATTLVCTQEQLHAQDQRDEAKPEQQDTRPDANKNKDAAKPDTDKPAADEAASPKQDQARPAEQRDKSAKPGENDNKAATQDRSAPATQKTAQDADRGSRIPDDKFRSNFGRQHTFAVQRTTIRGQAGFQYGGYSFTIVDAWPVGWAYTDQCYIDYIDGEYFLFDLAHPGVRIEVIVVL